jgi:hypothetical protein
MFADTHHGTLAIEEASSREQLIERLEEGADFLHGLAMKIGNLAAEIRMAE